jgi:RNA polymerase sigma-70 factor (ECF subfamily)
LPLAFSGDQAALLEGLRANHPGAKATFFQRYVKLVEHVVRHVLGFDAELADVHQEVFTSALTSIHSLQDPAALEAWLASIARRTAHKVLRGRSRRAWLRRFADSSEEERYEPAVMAVDIEARRALRVAYAALAQLPTAERFAFALRFIDGMALSDVATVSHVSLSTIKRRLARAERKCIRSADPVLHERVNRQHLGGDETKHGSGLGGAY